MDAAEKGGLPTSPPPTTSSLCLFVSLRSSKAHPGPVVHISDNPMDEGKVSQSKRGLTVLSY